MHGNPHTGRGRMAVDCPHNGYGYTVSKYEITEMSPEAAIWIDGFLCGNEPEMPLGEDGFPIEDDGSDPRYVEWRQGTVELRRTGRWPQPEEEEVAAVPPRDLWGTAGSARFVRCGPPEYRDLVLVSQDSEPGEIVVQVAHEDNGTHVGVAVLDVAAARELAAAIPRHGRPRPLSRTSGGTYRPGVAPSMHGTVPPSALFPRRRSSTAA